MMNSGFKYDATTSTYLPDISELTLFCEGQKVGTCTVDLASYIDKKAVSEKAIMSEGDIMHLTGRHLIGNHTQFPGAFLKFRIIVTQPVKAGAASNLSPTSSSTN